MMGSMGNTRRYSVILNGDTEKVKEKELEFNLINNSDWDTPLMR